ncbi:NUDIX domain-containing protein [Pelagibacterium lentulum]|uniref:NUDIX hydrolase n=1 Tax=Pelagibacterium lentulum TaxID=2029865 RepID=A0A916RJ15_9HYPH|nr:NUDIX domain-containing protein [Pelagibacterium lentulum]GGA55680.1 NUDIX hydrolase [Pelagibacterium lentulum]
MKPDACSIALFHNLSVFIIQRRYEPFRGLWTLPGGRIEAGESPSECVTRELFEETGFLIEMPRHVLTETIGKGDKRFKLAVFAAIHPFRAPLPSDEIMAWDWTEPDHFAGLETTPNLGKIVRACAAHLEMYDGDL